MFVLRPIPHHYIIWLLLAPLLFIEVYTLDALQRVVALQNPSQGQVVEARVFEQRSTARGIEVRYQFRLPGSATSYHAREAVGGASAWVPISAEAWSAAQRRGTLAVRYLAEDPWTNQPLGRIGYPVADSFCLWGLFLIFDMVWIAESYTIVRNFTRCLAMVERRTPHRIRFWESRHVVDPRYNPQRWQSSGGRQ